MLHLLNPHIHPNLNIFKQKLFYSDLLVEHVNSVIEYVNIVFGFNFKRNKTSPD